MTSRALPLLLTGLFACGGAPPSPAPADAAVATTQVKLCNFVARGGGGTTITVELGATPVRLSAATDRCSAEVDAPCAAVPVGDLAVTVKDGADVLGSVTARFEADHEYVVGTRLRADGRLVVSLVALEGFRCSTIDPMILVLTGRL